MNVFGMTLFGTVPKLPCSEKGVRLAQKKQVDPRIPVGIQL
jgi:hypothetical protein